MGVEIFVNDKQIELKEGTKFQFNFTIADIFNIGSVAVSYSNAFDVPTTPNNIQSFDGLGMIGNNSQVPYTKNRAVVKYDGFDVVPDGLAVLEDVGKSYRMGLHDGMMDFFKDIENKSIGKDLNISDLKHDKTMQNFKNSITLNLPYRYVVANFGGRTSLPNGIINIDYLIPVVKLSYFWNKIFETFGYTYTGSIFSNPDFADAYITYPKAPDNIVTLVPYATARKNSQRFNTPVVVSNNVYEFPAAYSWSQTNPGNTVFPNFWNFKSPTTESYRMNIKAVGYVRYKSPNGPLFDGQRPFRFEVWRGTTLIRTETSNSQNYNGTAFDFSMAAGEELTFKIKYYDTINTPIYLQLTSIELEISKTNLGSIDFAEAFSDFSIKDFVKEIIWRYGLTPIYNIQTKNLNFLTIDEKVNFNNYVDWSSKHVVRSKESYLYGTYGQSNIFQHKYNDEGDNFNNGNLSISNANLEASKTIVNSKIYSAEQVTRPIGDQNRKTNIYPIWRGEINEGSNGVEVNYKGLNGRYYIMKLNRINETLTFKSEILNNNADTVTYYYMPNETNTHYNDLVLKYYPTYQKILNNFKMHEIEVALSLPDIINLDFTKLYYFEQEASFYILNKLQWEEGKTCKGEFIKINK